MQAETRGEWAMETPWAVFSIRAACGSASIGVVLTKSAVTCLPTLSVPLRLGGAR